ncbi:hypothetical protein [Lake Baikal phage Baikal-20-5m-C28]|nr:hypothetical protein [Lake Baikal phage Baikal-20-5m-C28]
MSNIMSETSNYEVIDNFLDKEHFDTIKNTLTSLDMNWFYRDNMTSDDENGMCYFTHNFFIKNAIYSPFFNLLEPLLAKLNIALLIEVRSNMTISKEDRYESSWHIDNPYKNSKTAILYLTTCNAKTMINVENEILEIDSVENRILIFDTNISHKMKSATDAKRRIIINLNYIQN